MDMMMMMMILSYDAYGNTCMKFYEHILNGLKLKSGHDFVTETATYKVQRDVTQRVSKQEIWFLHSACRLMLVNICL